MKHTPRIYLDNAAATAVDPRVIEAMQPYWHEQYGNAGALHQEGVSVRTVIESARASIAQNLGSLPDEIIFTAGGTEANNIAIRGVVQAHHDKGTPLHEIHLITSTVEHSSVLDCFRALEKTGVTVSYVPVDTFGFVDLQALAQAIGPNTVLISLILAHNEIGTIARMHDIAKVVRTARQTHGTSLPLLHTDASQAPVWIPCDVRKLGIDLMTVDGQKMHGPKGVGCLYKSSHVTLTPILYGGGQEFGLRPGTPATPLIIGLAKALTIVEAERATYLPHTHALRDHFISKIQAQIPDATLNGALGDERLVDNVNFSFPGVDAEQCVLELDAQGIACSTRSACLLDNEPGSYVIRALGKSEVHATSTVRFSLSRHTTKEEIDRTISAVVETIPRLIRHNT